MENLSKLTIYQIVNDLPERYKPMSIEEQMMRKGGGDPSTWDRFVSWLRDTFSLSFLRPCHQVIDARGNHAVAMRMLDMKEAGILTFGDKKASEHGFDFLNITPGANWTGNEGCCNEGYGGNGTDPCYEGYGCYDNGYP